MLGLIVKNVLQRNIEFIAGQNDIKIEKLRGRIVAVSTLWIDVGGLKDSDFFVITKGFNAYVLTLMPLRLKVTNFSYLLLDSTLGVEFSMSIREFALINLLNELASY
mgnify:CR=1 FL=1